ncbi:hypothetical protein CDAR_418481 [Caerostris darwini]|uniref:Uncharacterized protein n=1 Tax=Caerostris darwini TaxID=1538125 RepID=A0AAV4MV54_9ARAC|nr:hypothetical protein CDAR_418481 [Caerostris darwini]
MLTEPPMLSDADHCTNITAARAQLKDKEKAVDLIRQILQNQNILIDGGVIQRTALKSTMDGLKTAEAALAEATKRQKRWMRIGRLKILPGAMETAEDEWWRRMERAETIDYSVRASAPGASNPVRVRQYPRSCWPRLYFTKSYLKKNDVHAYQL